MNKNQVKNDAIDGSILNGVRQPLLFSFVLNKPLGYKVFCQSGTTHHEIKKQNCFENNNILFGR